LAFELAEPDAVLGVGDVEVEHGPDEREKELGVRLMEETIAWCDETDAALEPPDAADSKP
jgi:hypothetical protein